MNLNTLLFASFLVALGYFIYAFFLYPIVVYVKFGLQIGFDKVALIYKPFVPLMKMSLDATQAHGSSFGYHLHEVRKNPMVQIIVARLIVGTVLYVTDAELIRKLSYTYVKYLEKAEDLIFLNEIKKGLIFQEKEEWKKSRGIISNVFHFDILKSREYVMEKVIAQKIKNLEQGVNLLKFGRSIGGEVVMKSLFGEEYFETKINGNTPFQQCHQILYSLLDESFSVTNIIMMVLGKTTTKDTKLLSQSQKKLLAKISNFKQVTEEFLHKQFKRYKEGAEVPPFLEVYFKLDDVSYFPEMVEQLFIFLFAGEDTTGAAIEMSLALLAEHPQFQDRILSDVKEGSIHSSKELNNFINEMTRKQTIVNMNIDRIPNQTFTVDGITFQKGVRIAMLIAAPMINPKYWENPEEFNPDRFNSTIQNATALIPFSSGPRNCIGQHMALMEIRITLVRILQKYRLEKAGTSLKTNAGLNITGHLVDSNFVKFVPKN